MQAARKGLGQGMSGWGCLGYCLGPAADLRYHCLLMFKALLALPDCPARDPVDPDPFIQFIRSRLCA